MNGFRHKQVVPFSMLIKRVGLKLSKISEYPCSNPAHWLPFMSPLVPSLSSLGAWNNNYSSLLFKRMFNFYFFVYFFVLGFSFMADSSGSSCCNGPDRQFMEILEEGYPQILNSVDLSEGQFFEEQGFWQMAVDDSFSL